MGDIVEHPIGRILISIIGIGLSISLINDAVEQFRDPKLDKLGYWKWSALFSGILGALIGFGIMVTAIWELM